MFVVCFLLLNEVKFLGLFTECYLELRLLVSFRASHVVLQEGADGGCVELHQLGFSLFTDITLPLHFRCVEHFHHCYSLFHHSCLTVVCLRVSCRLHQPRASQVEKLYHPPSSTPAISIEVAREIAESLQGLKERELFQLPMAEDIGNQRLGRKHSLAVDTPPSMPARTIYCVQLPHFRWGGGTKFFGCNTIEVSSTHANGDLYQVSMQVPDNLEALEECFITVEHVAADLTKELLIRELLDLGYGKHAPLLRYSSTIHAILPCGGEITSSQSRWMYMYEQKFPASYDLLVKYTLKLLGLDSRSIQQLSQRAKVPLPSDRWLDVTPNQLLPSSFDFPTSSLDFPTAFMKAGYPGSSTHRISYSPMSNFASPASFMTASSPASFMTAKSTYASPAYSTATGLSPASFMTARSTYASPAFTTATVLTPAMRIATIREDEPADPAMPPPLKKLRDGYYESLHQQNIVQPFHKELNWSGKGQHVTFLPTDTTPLRLISHLGASMTAKVDKVLCRRIALARKTIRCSRQWSIADAMREMHHLQNLRHFHIVQLVGSYLQGRDFSILMYPAADCHLGTFLEDAVDFGGSSNDYHQRIGFLGRSFACLTSAIAYIHKHTTKHMDIKPQNILVRETHFEDNRWRIYIADFGLSRSFTSQGHSQTDGPTSRTPRYCAPEVFQYELRGRSADIFSLGCVLLEMMTVISGKDPQDFADFRRGEGTDDSFHANLPRVLQWANNVCFKWCLPHPHVGMEVSLDRGRPPFNLYQRDAVCMMVDCDPAARPTAEELLKYPIFPPWPCCNSSPEEYVAYESPDP
jgi:serine/threonine protein kinase